MATKAYDYLVFIGRFQPFHNGHKRVVDEALKQANRVIILCGSAYRPRSLRNPWTFAERQAMIQAVYSESDNQRLTITPLLDSVYNDDMWVKKVQQTVGGIVASEFQAVRQPKIGLIGHKKDETSYYLGLFPQWDNIDVVDAELYNGKCCEATIIRNVMFGEGQVPKEVLNPAVVGMLENYLTTDDYTELKNEYDFIADYKKGWEAAPYAPTFVTTDAVVIQSGHVLLVERKARPGKGLMALPGGFIGQQETLLDSCIRELREETKLKVPEPVLKGSVTKQAVFDDPNRSTRGRTITHAFMFNLQPTKTLPKVKGSDDAKHAMWVPLAELEPEKMYEDHFFIIQKLVGEA